MTLLLLLLASCGGAERSGGGTGDPRVGVYVSSNWGFDTSSYWIEGPDGLLLVDTQFLPSAAEAFVRRAEEATGKRARLAVVLHANPDKYNGVGVMRRHGIRVVSAAAVVARIPEIDVERRRSFAVRYAPDYPEALVLPESFGDATTVLRVGGLEVTAHVLGPGCSNAHVVLEWQGHVFPGDLVANGSHSWLKEADLGAWLARLAEMEAMRPRFVHPGRGATGGPGLLAAEREYLTRARALVAAEHPRVPLDPAAVDRVERAMLDAYPRHHFPVFVRGGIPAEFRRQAQAAPP